MKQQDATQKPSRKWHVIGTHATGYGVSDPSGEIIVPTKSDTPCWVATLHVQFYRDNPAATPEQCTQWLRELGVTYSSFREMWTRIV